MSKLEKKLVVGRGKHTQSYTLKESHFFIEFHPSVLDDQISDVLKKYQLEPIEISLPFHRVTKTTKNTVNIRRWVKTSSKMDINDILKIDIIRIAAPVYIEEGLKIESAVAPLPDVLILEIPEEPSKALLKILSERFDLHLVPIKGRDLRKFKYFRIGKEGKSKYTSYEIKDEVQKLDEVSFAEFDWAKMIPEMLIPNDTHWENQWDMVNINTVGGWDLQQGSSNVVIAVIDSGIDLTHPDLTFLPQADHYNAAEDAAGTQPPFNAGPVSPHGTAVAGIAAAILNNNRGVAGVGGGCTILPAYHGGTSSGAANSIDWAVNHGANVINMSFSATPTADLEDAVENADTAGLVMAAAAGNYNIKPIVYPARYSEVIAVGASDQNDERKRPGSPDRECWWGSCYGDELDVMAPGVLVWTTDEQGANGYNSNGAAVTVNYPDAVHPLCTVNYATTGDVAGDYYANFSGTSAATPHVSGLAALIISRYPTLTNHEVREIIERTCRKVSPGTYAYDQEPGRLNGSWHEEMGYGLISVQCALRYAELYAPTLVGVIPIFNELLNVIVTGQMIDIAGGFIPEFEIPNWHVFDPVPDIFRLVEKQTHRSTDFQKLEEKYRYQVLKYQKSAQELQKQLKGNMQDILDLKHDIYKEFWKIMSKKFQ